MPAERIEQRVFAYQGYEARTFMLSTNASGLSGALASSHASRRRLERWRLLSVSGKAFCSEETTAHPEEAAFSQRPSRRVPAEQDDLCITGGVLSTHLAELCEVEPRLLIQAVKRNSERFPADFMFQLTTEEFASLKSQIGLSTSLS